jgi:tight adherence protein C
MDPLLIIAAVCAMGCFFLIAYALRPASEGSSISQRLEGLKAGQQKQRAAVSSLRDEDEMSKSVFVRVIIPMVDRTSKFFSQITPMRSLDRARMFIVRAGMQGKVTPARITSFSYILMIALPLMILPTAHLIAHSTIMFIGIVGIAAILGYRLPYGFIEGKAKARQNEIRKALPFTLDLISISVEAGMALDGAMAIVMEKSTGPMADELNLTLREIRLGKGRNEALIDLGERIGLDELKAFVTAVTYIARLGGSLVDVIRIQAAAMRLKRRQRAEEKAMKTPVKIMIPLVLFIFPSMFIVILGPAVVEMMENMKVITGQ